MTYSDKLKDPRWQRKRLEVLKHDNWQCVICGNGKETLHIHHTFYKKGAEPWDYSLSSLVTVCETHHSYLHNIDLKKAQIQLILEVFELRKFDTMDYQEILEFVAGKDPSEWGQKIEDRNRPLLFPKAAHV